MIGRLTFYTVCVVAGYGLYSLVNTLTDYEPPLIYIEASTDTKNVYAGDQLEIKYDVYRERICPTAKINRYIVDSDGTVNSVTEYTLSTATRPGRERYDRVITIPKTITPGPAYYYVQLQYQCTWVHKLFSPITVRSPAVHFNVLKPLNPSSGIYGRQPDQFYGHGHDN